MKPKPFFVLGLLLSGCFFCCFNVVLFAEKLESTNYPSASFTFYSTNANGIVTSKMIRLESTNANEIMAAWASNYVKFFSTLTNTDHTNAQPDNKELAAFMLTNAGFCALTNSAFLAEVSTIGEAAATFLQDLQEKGRLPGASKDSEGDGGLDDILKESSFNSQKIKYPISLTFHVVWSGDSLTNYYTVTQPAKDSAWQLQRAWRTDAEGHLIKEWPVK